MADVSMTDPATLTDEELATIERRARFDLNGPQYQAGAVLPQEILRLVAEVRRLRSWRSFPGFVAEKTNASIGCTCHPCESERAGLSRRPGWVLSVSAVGLRISFCAPCFLRWVRQDD